MAQKDPLTAKQINEKINETIKTKGRFSGMNLQIILCGVHFSGK
jgi:hypothetical protein